MSLLKYDQELFKSLGLSEADDLEAGQKVSFVRDQIEGIQQQMWRSRVDVMLNRGLKTTTDAEKAAVATKIAEHEADIKRFAQALALLGELKAELN